MSRFKHVLAWALLLWLVALPVMATGHGDTTILGKDYVLENGQELADNLVVLGGQVRLEEGSTVRGDVTIMAGEAELSGRVEGDVVILGGTATLGGSAYVDGDVVVLGQLRRDPEATIAGNLVQGAEAGRGLEALPEALSNVPGFSAAAPSAEQPVDPSSSLGRTMANLAALLLVLLVAALAVTLAPEPLARLRSTLFASPLLSLGVGLLTLIVVGILAPILVVICIGIPVAIVAAVAVALAALIGWVVAGQVAGEQVTAWLKLPVASPVGQTLIGVLLISLLSQIPCLGPTAAFLVAAAAIGAAVLTRFGTMPHQAPGAPAAQGQPPSPAQPGALPAPTPRRDTKPLDPFAAPDATDDPRRH